MTEINLVYEATRLLLTLGAAALGSYFMWKLIGPKIVRKYGATAIWNKIASLAQDPASEDNQKLAAAAGIQVAYVMQSMLVDMETDEGKAKYRPFLEIFHKFIAQSIFGTYGAIIKKLKDEGAPIGDELGVPDEVAGIAGKMFPGVDIKQTVGLLQWLGKASPGSGNGLGAEMQSGGGGGGSGQT